MALETGTYISDLVVTNPVGATDTKGQGDDHLRLIKAALKNTFPNITGAVTKTHTQLNDPQVITLPIGTKMLFVQTAAPTGWTKDVVHNDKALRIVSGVASTGGTVAFTTAFASKAVTGSNTAVAITEAQMPSHTHTQQGTFTSAGQSANHTHAVNINTGTESATHTHQVSEGSNVGTAGGLTSGDDFTNTVAAQSTTSANNVLHIHNVNGDTGINSANHTHATAITGPTTSTGGDGTHNHTFTGTAINLAVQYVDCIICSKS